MVTVWEARVKDIDITLAYHAYVFARNSTPELFRFRSVWEMWMPHFKSTCSISVLIQKCITTLGQLYQTVEIEIRVRIIYHVFSFLYFSAADKNKEEPRIYGLMVVALLPYAAYGLYSKPSWWQEWQAFVWKWKVVALFTHVYLSCFICIQVFSSCIDHLIILVHVKPGDYTCATCFSVRCTSWPAFLQKNVKICMLLS